MMMKIANILYFHLIINLEDRALIQIYVDQSFKTMDSKIQIFSLIIVQILNFQSNLSKIEVLFLDLFLLSNRKNQNLSLKMSQMRAYLCPFFIFYIEIIFERRPEFLDLLFLFSLILNCKGEFNFNSKEICFFQSIRELVV